LYFGTDVTVTRAEYEEMWKGLGGADQPATEFIAEVNLQRVRDLTSPATLKALKSMPKRFSRTGAGQNTPTLTQLLGRAISEDKSFSAIRYPSAATGKGGLNLVIFRDCVSPPDFVNILGPTRKPLQNGLKPSPITSPL